MSLLQIPFEIVASLFGWTITDFILHLRQIRFDRRHTPGAYESVLGSKMLRFLDDTYGVAGWSWEIRLLDIDRAKNVFRVRYDDCGGWAGTAEISLGTTQNATYKIIEKQKRNWPPPQ